MGQERWLRAWSEGVSGTSKSVGSGEAERERLYKGERYVSLHRDTRHAAPRTRQVTLDILSFILGN